jgi:AcrR family transcriptional regulator
LARKVNAEEFAAKRREILDTAHRLVFTKGFEQMSIRDIQDQLGISSGAFHHYFGSREALLAAYIERMKEEAGKPILPLVQDPHLSAIQKLQGFFDTLDSLRADQRAQIALFLKIWYTDSNALVRQKVDEALFEQRVPWITEIVHQGLREGVFHVATPKHTAEAIQALMQGMSNTHARLILAIVQEFARPQATENRANELVSEIVTTHAAYMDAIERVLGAPANSLTRTDAAAVNLWVNELRNKEKEPLK